MSYMLLSARPPAAITPIRVIKDDLPRYDRGLSDMGLLSHACEGARSRLPDWCALTAYSHGSAELVVNPATGEVEPVPRYGSYNRSMQAF